MKRYAIRMSLILCGIALAFAGKANVSGSSESADRISSPGRYSGYSDAIYDDKYELTSQYVPVSDGTRLAMDLYRPRDKATGKVIKTRLPV